MHVIAAKAVAFKEALNDDFKAYQKQVVKNTKFLAEELKKLDFRLVSGGTDNHLILIDVRNKGLTGKDAETMLNNVGIATNKNTIPNDPESPFVTSGVRIGTAAMTTRGMKETEMREIAVLISEGLKSDIEKKDLRQKAYDLCDRFPLY